MQQRRRLLGQYELKRNLYRQLIARKSVTTSVEVINNLEETYPSPLLISLICNNASGKFFNQVEKLLELLEFKRNVIATIG